VSSAPTGQRQKYGKSQLTSRSTVDRRRSVSSKRSNAQSSSYLSFPTREHLAFSRARGGLSLEPTLSRIGGAGTKSRLSQSDMLAGGMHARRQDSDPRPVGRLRSPAPRDQCTGRGVGLSGNLAGSSDHRSNIYCPLARNSATFHSRLKPKCCERTYFRLEAPPGPTLGEPFGLMIVLIMVVSSSRPITARRLGRHSVHG